MIDELRWLIGLNLVLAIWLGMLADSWKGRRMYAWIAIGLVTSVFGIVLLLYVKKLPKNLPRVMSALPKVPTRFHRSNSSLLRET